jgi:hypothetical protein
MIISTSKANLKLYRITVYCTHLPAGSNPDGKWVPPKRVKAHKKICENIILVKVFLISTYCLFYGMHSENAACRAFVRETLQGLKY